MRAADSEEEIMTSGPTDCAAKLPTRNSHPFSPFRHILHQCIHLGAEIIKMRYYIDVNSAKGGGT